jgi:hypothetical protein
MIAQSESIGALAAALAAAQGEIENAGKNAANPHFKSRYADLAEILNTVRPVLSRHGIAVIQSPSFEQGETQITTLLMHTSGEWVRGTCGAPTAKMDPQGVGSACTYLRRYSLAAFCGIAQEDDDANAASGRRAPEPTRAAPPPPAEPIATPEQRAELDRCIAALRGAPLDAKAAKVIGTARALLDSPTALQAHVLAGTARLVKILDSIEKAA